ncbi:hypothetical protein T01_6961 [Trichinella spiralis]|uniref:Uncharacterized protein n=1 Tax=Trichinella spiralis TaxID=6334 RepID=A0A0V1B056_TRISP|nr:hypothetical protein T01_6961 [Trichinella spiralis]
MIEICVSCDCGDHIANVDSGRTRRRPKTASNGTWTWSVLGSRTGHRFGKMTMAKTGSSPKLTNNMKEIAAKRLC